MKITMNQISTVITKGEAFGSQSGKLSRSKSGGGTEEECVPWSVRTSRLDREHVDSSKCCCGLQRVKKATIAEQLSLLQIDVASKRQRKWREQEKWKGKGVRIL